MAFVESEIIELKSEIVGSICKDIIAFANTCGGTLYIGVADDGSVVGIQNADKEILKLNNMIKDNIKPDLTMFIHYSTQDIDQNQIIIVTVQKGTDRPYYLADKGLKPAGVFVRNGTSSDPATDNAIRKMIKDTDGDSFESMRALEQNLTFEAAGAKFASNNIQFDSVKMKTLGMLSADGVYSNCAFLLSDQCISTIKTAVFAGSDKCNFQDRREFSGSIFKQMDDLYEYLDLQNHTKATFSGLYRTDLRDYPEEALREALLNSIIHRDYSINASTLVNVYEDRIEFISVGGLTSGIVLDDIMLGLSICRNPILAGIFYRLKLIESYGTGLPKIMDAYNACARKPKIEVTANAFKITLPNRNYTAYEIPVDNLPDCVCDSESQQVLDYAKRQGQITRGSVEDLLGVSQATSGRILKKLVEDGRIRRVGNGKTTHYKVE